MSNNNIVYMIMAAVAVMAILLVLNFTSIFTKHNEVKELLSKNDIKGMAVDHEGTLWTLNFAQQNFVVDAVNKALPMGKQAPAEDGEKPKFKRIVIYRFNGDNMEINPIAYNNNNLVFTLSSETPSRILRENTNGDLKTLLQNSFDH